MNNDLVSVTRLGRALRALARFGLDLRPFVQSIQGAIIRPTRRELASLSTELRHDLAREATAAQSEIAQLHDDLARQAAAAETQITELRRELGQTAGRNEQLIAQLAAQAGNFEKQMDALRREFSDVAQESTRHDGLLAQLTAQLAAEHDGTSRLKARGTTSAREAADFRGEIRQLLAEVGDQVRVLEQILTEPPADSDAREDGPLISVVMPTRDRAQVIAAAIQSVQSQRYRHWELIIVDDGSSDATADTVRKFLKDTRIRFVKQPALGAAAARNHALRLAQGKVITYLDSDNEWYPSFLAAVAITFRDQGIDIAYGALVTESHGLNRSRVLYRRFDRAVLLEHNFIDINALAHRRELVDRHGGFDERLDRLIDWDLLLKYTADHTPKLLPVLAARYRADTPNRITATRPAGPNILAIRRKWRVLPAAAKKLRVLYVVWHYPQLSETYIETEIRCMLRFGVHIEVWCEAGPAASYPPSLPVHRGTLDEAIACVRPDLLHIHWLSFGHNLIDVFERHRLPITVRAHGFEFNAELVDRILAWPRIARVYLFPHQHAAVGTDDARVRALPSAFDTELFKPNAAKDRRLVVRTSAGLASKQLQFIFELAKEVPDHRFVVAAVTCKDAEGYIDELRDDWRRSGTPAELLIDVPREQVAELVARAGHYLHSGRLPGEPHATPIGMPISIAEAMATGAHILVRDIPALTDYAAEAGTAYRDLDDAAGKLRRASHWTDEEWRDAWMRSVERAFSLHADEIALLPLLHDWCDIADAGKEAQSAPAAKLVSS